MNGKEEKDPFGEAMLSLAASNVTGSICPGTEDDGSSMKNKHLSWLVLSLVLMSCRSQTDHSADNYKNESWPVEEQVASKEMSVDEKPNSLQINLYDRCYEFPIKFVLGITTDPTKASAIHFVSTEGNEVPPEVNLKANSIDGLYRFVETDYGMKSYSPQQIHVWVAREDSSHFGVPQDLLRGYGVRGYMEKPEDTFYNVAGSTVPKAVLCQGQKCFESQASSVLQKQYQRGHSCLIVEMSDFKEQ